MDSINPLAKTIPEALFMLYQMTFADHHGGAGGRLGRGPHALLRLPLVLGAVADLRLCADRALGVGRRLPWGAAGVLDFAGGTVVHINAGIAGLVAALLLGPRRGYGTENLAPFDLSLAVIGTGLLWVGWFGFNGGSALGANSRAVMAITATHLAACAGALTWMAIEWWTRGKPSVLGMISGAVAGLGTITPASGFVLPWHGIVIGVIAGGVCFWACTCLKHRFKYDDSLDVFGVHGIGGMTGTLLAGVFATAAVSIAPDAIPLAVRPLRVCLISGPNYQQLMIQLFAVVVTMAWSQRQAMTVVRAEGAARRRDGDYGATQDEEREGLDISIHGEAIQ